MFTIKKQINKGLVEKLTTKKSLKEAQDFLKWYQEFRGGESELIDNKLIIKNKNEVIWYEN